MSQFLHGFRLNNQMVAKKETTLAFLLKKEVVNILISSRCSLGKTMLIPRNGGPNLIGDLRYVNER